MGGPGDAWLFFFFGRDPTLASVREVRNVLALGWLLAVTAAALYGRAVAKGTLRPVGAVARASARLTEQMTGRPVAYPGDDEVGTLTTAFGAMATAVQEKIDELSEHARRERRFTADVAHELRTPLTSMASLTAVLTDQIDELPADARRPVELLAQSVERLRHLVVELLELARLDSEGHEQTRLVPVRVRDAVRLAIEECDVEPIVDIDGDLFVYADPLRFRRVLINLLDNAKRHAGVPTTVIARQRDRPLHHRRRGRRRGNTAGRTAGDLRPFPQIGCVAFVDRRRPRSRDRARSTRVR